MTLAISRVVLVLSAVLSMGAVVLAQELRRPLEIAEGAGVEIINNYGRIAVKAVRADGTNSLTAISPGGISDSDLKLSSNGGRVSIETSPKDKSKRIDLIIEVPERTKLKATTRAGAIEAFGNFTSIDAKTDTGTIVADTPDEDVIYHLQWTESRPRYLADYDIAEVKEKSGGRFEIKGVKREKVKTDKDETKVPPDGTDPTEKTKKQKPNTQNLTLTTARGIILLNVPPNEVNSDLRERPLTNAAKAIVRSGDSLLTEAIRRASPKYFGDYTRTLPPLRLEPRFAVRPSDREVPNANVKTAVVRAVDLANRAIAGLDATDFEVVESGKAREIVSVRQSQAPFNLVLLLDVSGSVENYVNFIRKAARNFVDTVGAQDRVSIVIFNEDVKKLSGFTTDKGRLSESLDTFDAGGGTAYYDAIGYTIADALRELKGDRTAVVILTDGDDNRSFLPFDSLAGSIQESGALIYPLYVPSGLIAFAAQNQNSDLDPMRKKYMSLTAKSEGEGEKLAKISGGVYYSITEIGQIQRAYEDIVRQMRSAYSITYRSESAPGVSPKLKIRVKRDNVFTTITSVVAADGR